MRRATTPSFARSATDDAETLFGHEPSLRLQRLNSLRPADYTVECSDEIYGRRRGVRQLRRGDDRIVNETTAGDAAGNYTIVRTFTATDDAETLFGHATITVQDTTAPEFTFVPADYTVECSDEMYGRRHGVRRYPAR